MLWLRRLFKRSKPLLFGFQFRVFHFIFQLDKFVIIMYQFLDDHIETDASAEFIP